MLENPTDSSSTPNITTVKRYAPPNQRNRSLSRRKSGGVTWGRNGILYKGHSQCIRLSLTVGCGREDRFERTNNNYMNDGEKNQVATSRNIHVADHGDLVGSNVANDNPHSGLISLHGCSRSKAFQLLNDRWVAAISAYNDPSIDLADEIKVMFLTKKVSLYWFLIRCKAPAVTPPLNRPVMYSGSGASPWGQFRLPHQLMSPTPTSSGGPPSGLQMDFLSELRCAMQDANASSDA
ncbi:hypothetical protein TEA_011266 [Camellia sinensis var. sinensis]|uniref:Uncharacterized protein n=1 Tax=Camellia sinensis var. sinensis TaxID=542762 RepID=A0A4S4ESS9_CAMSN|nr:hypothetical protein TEA_011266 [Camellia sinensis var. sinensis]